jgi:DNA-binding transcriptional MocR family regulator
MLLPSPWSPRLADIRGRPFERLSAALAEDIANGAIGAGDRLPAHRDLAYQLQIGVGTVTKAYQDLERRGLVRSVRGCGMFVAGLSIKPLDLVDLSINAPPKVLGDRLLATTLATLARRLDASTFGSYAPAAGLPEHRAAMARWLARRGIDAPPERVFLTHGAQHALSIAFASVCRPRCVVLTEAATYPGAIALARQSGWRMEGLDTDAEGITPEALAQALHRHRRGGPLILYVTPTLQNPTTATMTLRRRREIVRLCRESDVVIVEDDVYCIFAPHGLPPLAALAPDRTLHVSGLSKALSPGLRVGSLAVPAAWSSRISDGLRASCTMASLLDGTIMAQWLGDGTAESVAVSMRAEAKRRAKLATALCPGVVIPATPGFHVWLPMPVQDAEHLVSRASAAGIALMPARAPLLTENAAIGGVRISLGGPSIETLSRALSTLAGAIVAMNEAPMVV